MTAPLLLVEQDSHQTRVAVIEEGRVVELYLERQRARGVAGNVYKGRVHRVLPGMQAAFVDIGLERDAFLHVADVADEGADGGEADEESPPPAEVTPSIADLVRPGQELLVQVVKDPLPSKGARLTTHVTLPGRYLVLAPTGARRGVSRRIADEGERERLKGLVGQLPGPAGLIVRTAAEGRGPDDLAADAAYLGDLWERLRERARSLQAPALVHRDLDLAVRVVRDLFDESFAALHVEGEEGHRRIVDFAAGACPALVDRIGLHEGQPPLFELHGVEDEIDQALRPRVWLESGGYLVINPTEALVAIDVNTGRFVGGAGLDATILQTNLEAVAEIVRQIRLRSLSGILVLDLIDMTDSEHRRQVSAALERELRRDRVKSNVLSISEFGLVEITRKRARPSLESLLTHPCPHCEGRGRIRNPATVALALRRAVLAHRTAPAVRELRVRLHPSVARALLAEEAPVREEIERKSGLALLLDPDESLHHECFEIVDA